MTYEIIATGSSGNAVLIDGSVLIDCGVSWKALKPYADKIKVVFLTHEHGDHFKGSTIRALHYEHPAVRFSCREWMIKPLTRAGVPPRQIDLLPEEPDGLCYPDGMVVMAQEVPHDARNCALMVTINAGRLFYCTDCGSLDGVEARDYDLYLIEANYGEDEIEERISRKLDAGEYAYETRAKANHLSKEQAMAWLAKNMGRNSRYVLLHQHQERGRDDVGPEGDADSPDP